MAVPTTLSPLNHSSPTLDWFPTWSTVVRLLLSPSSYLEQPTITSNIGQEIISKDLVSG